MLENMITLSGPAAECLCYMALEEGWCVEEEIDVLFQVAFHQLDPLLLQDLPEGERRGSCAVLFHIPAHSSFGICGVGPGHDRLSIEVSQVVDSGAVEPVDPLVGVDERLCGIIPG